MPVFVQLFYTNSMSGAFNRIKDTKTLNNILTCLQEKGAKILDIKVSMGMKEGGVKAGVIYLIIYEANSPIKCT